ncbi:hypothetical protein [Streptomyces sp. NPDC000878]
MGALIVMLSCRRSMCGRVAPDVFDRLRPLITDQESMLELVTWTELGREYRPPEA